MKRPGRPRPRGGVASSLSSPSPMRSAARSRLLLRLCAAWALACCCATSSVAEESGVTQLADLPLDALLDVQVSGASKFAMRVV